MATFLPMVCLLKLFNWIELLSIAKCGFFELIACRAWHSGCPWSLQHRCVLLVMLCYNTDTNSSLCVMRLNIFHSADSQILGHTLELSNLKCHDTCLILVFAFKFGARITSLFVYVFTPTCFVFGYTWRYFPTTVNKIFVCHFYDFQARSCF
jgi:hypothetical protein